MNEREEVNNHAYIDGQNLYLATTMHEEKPWKVDLVRFREYLRAKYKVNKAYYFLGFVNDEHQELYTKIQEAGFILEFREHHSAMLGLKKGNVDCDIVFSIMRSLYKKELPNKVVLVSGDGDYKKLVDFLIKEDKFEKLLFPDQKRASSLYKKIDTKYPADLNQDGVRNKIGQKEKGSLGS